MNTIFSLLKLQIDNQTDILKAANPKTMALSIIKAVTILLLVTLGVSFALSRVFNLGFAINAPLLALILLITQLVSLAFGIGNVINTLYLCKDNEMLFCLPVAPNQLFISKILMIYNKELAVNTMITFPLLVTLGSFSSYGLSYYLSIPILLLVLPILPIVVAAFLSVPLMSIIGFLKKHALLSIISILLLVSACLYAYITLIGGMASEFNIANQQLETVVKINAAISEIGTKIPVYISLATAMTDFGGWYYFPIFLLLCVGVCSLTILFTRYFFFKIAMTSIEKTVKVKARVKKFKKRGAFHSLFLKELYCIFRSPTDIFEYFLFTLLMPFIVFSYDKLLMSITVNQAGTNMISGAHLMVVAILAMLSNISSASAVSRDGSNSIRLKLSL